MKKPLLIMLGSAAITAAVLKAVPALAEPAPAPATFVSLVHTADLDLGSAVGQRILDQRLATAVRDVCGEASDSDLAGKNAIRRCRVATLDRAHAERDGLLVAAGHSAAIAVTAAR